IRRCLNHLALRILPVMAIMGIILSFCHFLVTHTYTHTYTQTHERTYSHTPTHTLTTTYTHRPGVGNRESSRWAASLLGRSRILFFDICHVSPSSLKSRLHTFRILTPQPLHGLYHARKFSPPK